MFNLIVPQKRINRGLEEYILAGDSRTKCLVLLQVKKTTKQKCRQIILVSRTVLHLTNDAINFMKFHDSHP